jgi:hypothetical protein
MQIGVLLTALAQYLSISTPPTSFLPPSYKQCDARWGNVTLGFGPDTLCQAGCLMTSITSAVAGYNISINGSVPLPPDMNTWLQNNNGFVSGDLFVWNAIEPLGFTFNGFVNTSVAISENIMKKNVVILNVKNGHHYVLCLGINAYGYAAMDPATPGKNIYNFSEVVRAGVYTYTGVNNAQTFLTY